MNDRKINYIEFVVKDIAATKKFYGEVFGWSFTDYGPDYAAFSESGVDGGFTTDGKFKPGGALVIVYAANLEELYAAVRDAGARITKEIFAFPGGRRFHFLDPSGHELAVWSDVP